MGTVLQLKAEKAGRVQARAVEPTSGFLARGGEEQGGRSGGCVGTWWPWGLSQQVPAKAGDVSKTQPRALVVPSVDVTPSRGRGSPSSF